MTDSEKHELAERHYHYTEGLLKAAGHIPTPLEHYLYITAFLHGMKHNEPK